MIPPSKPKKIFRVDRLEGSKDEFVLVDDANNVLLVDRIINRLTDRALYALGADEVDHAYCRKDAEK